MLRKHLNASRRISFTLLILSRMLRPIVLLLNRNPLEICILQAQFGLSEYYIVVSFNDIRIENSMVPRCKIAGKHPTVRLF